MTRHIFSCKSTGNELFELFFNMSQKIGQVMLEYRTKHWINETNYNDYVDWNKDCKEASYLRVLYYPKINKSEVIQRRFPDLFKIFKNLLNNITSIHMKLNALESVNRNKQFYAKHCDLGLLTFGCHATNNGLQIKIPKTDKWINVYDILNDNDIIIYSGYTMSLISCGYYKPLLHKVDMNLNNFKHKHRLSMPFFYRFNDNVQIPLFKQQYFQNSNILNKTISVAEMFANLQKQRFLKKIKFIHLKIFWNITFEFITKYSSSQQKRNFLIWSKDFSGI